MQYRVQPNDTPQTIAWRFTRNPGRYVEIILANPHKPRSGSTFASLTTDEVLNLPAAWTAGRGLRGLGQDPGDGSPPGGNTGSEQGGTTVGNDVSGCPSGMRKDVNGVCAPINAGTGCPTGMVQDRNGNCVKQTSGGGGGGAAPTPPSPGPLQNVGLTTSSGIPSWVWWAVGGAAVVAGGGLVYYATKPKAGAAHGARPPMHPSMGHPARSMSNPRHLHHRHIGRRLGR